MSIDLIENSLSLRTIAYQRARVEVAVGGRAPSPIVDLVIIFGGWGIQHSGEPLAPGAASGSATLVERVQALRVPGARQLVVSAWQGETGGAPQAVEEASSVVFRRFHPLGKFIVYGYSAGGFNALQLSYRFGLTYPYYNVDARTFERYPPPLGTAGPHPVAGFVRIDRLITVDAASGPMSGWAQRRVWPSVRRNLNIYQTHPSTIRSHGGPTEAVDTTATRVDNEDWTSRYEDQSAHGRIDEDSNDRALAAIQEELGASQ